MFVPFLSLWHWTYNVSWGWRWSPIIELLDKTNPWLSSSKLTRSVVPWSSWSSCSIVRFNFAIVVWAEFRRFCTMDYDGDAKTVVIFDYDVDPKTALSFSRWGWFWNTAYLFFPKHVINIDRILSSQFDSFISMKAEYLSFVKGKILIKIDCLYQILTDKRYL